MALASCVFCYLHDPSYFIKWLAVTGWLFFGITELYIGHIIKLILDTEEIIHKHGGQDK